MFVVYNSNMKSNSTSEMMPVADNENHRRSTYKPGNCALPSPNITDMLSGQVRTCRRKSIQNSKISGVLVLLTLGLIYYEKEEASEGELMRSNVLRVTIALLCVGQGLLVYQYYLIKLQERKTRREVCLYSSLWQDKFLCRRFLLELLISLMCMPPFLSREYETVFLALSFPKYYLLLKTLFELSPRNTERTKYYCGQFNCEPGLSFTLKCYSNDFPFLSIACLWIFFLVNFALMVRTIEGTSELIYGFFWLSGVTQTSVGYGDIVPTTFLGRTFSGLNALCGNFINSLSLLFIRSYLDFSKQEDKFYKNVKLLKVNLNEEASCYIQCWWRYLQKYRKKTSRLYELQKYMISFYKFKKARMGPLFHKQKSLKHELNEVDVLVSKHLKNFRKKIKNFKDIKYKALCAVSFSNDITEKFMMLHFRNELVHSPEDRIKKKLHSQNNHNHHSLKVDMKLKRDLALKKFISKTPDALRSLKNSFDHQRLPRSSDGNIVFEQPL